MVAVIAWFLLLVGLGFLVRCGVLSWAVGPTGLVLLNDFWLPRSSDVTVLSNVVLEIGLDDDVLVLKLSGDPSSSPPSWCL